MQDIDLAEAGVTQQPALKEHWPGRVFTIHIGEDLIAVLLAFERRKIVAIAVPHDVLYSFDFMGNEIEDPKRAARAQPAEDLGERLGPLVLIAKMMEHGEKKEGAKRPARHHPEKK